MDSAALETPIGWLQVTVNDGELTGAGFADAQADQLADVSDACRSALDQLGEYFEGDREVFDLPLAPDGSEFEHRVWDEVLRIPFGSTASYGSIAARLGDPGASRAVGLANARNPLAILVPCHRVVGADGDLTGYAGGLWRKKWLLAHESGQSSLF